MEQEVVCDPLSVVQQLFDDGGVDGLSRVRDVFASRLSPDLIKQLPLLDSSSLTLPDGSLVRYRGMVQDQFDPEVYFRVYHAVHSVTGDRIKCFGQYRDANTLPQGYDVDYDDPGSVAGDRNPIYCVPIPGETPWVVSYHKTRPLPTAESTLTSSVKRKLSEGEGVCEDCDGRMEVEGDSPQNTKRVCGAERPCSSMASRPDNTPSLNHPLPGETRPPCLVKVYSEAEVLAVATMVEFVGILSCDPSLSLFESSSDGDSTHLVDPEAVAEHVAHSPPPSLVPRLHCIMATPLTHCNPLVSQSLSAPFISSAFQDIGCNVLSCREALLEMLSAVLYGDKLAAEYILIHLISSVYGRTDVLALGKFSVNLTGSPAHMATPLYNLIQQLVTMCYLLPLSLSTMNQSQFSPHKDYTTNRLVTGLLQLAPGTHLIVDETTLQCGQLGEKGVNNLTALGYMIQWQKIKYDFQYHCVEFECDLPVLILSEGRSILSVDCRVPLQLTDGYCPPSTDSLMAELSNGLLQSIRQYLTLARQLQYNLDPILRETLEEEFVEMRRTDSTMNADMFHHLLSLARLVSLSYGEDSLTVERWRHAKRLDNRRRARLT